MLIRPETIYIFPKIPASLVDSPRLNLLFVVMVRTGTNFTGVFSSSILFELYTPE